MSAMAFIYTPKPIRKGDNWDLTVCEIVIGLSAFGLKGRSSITEV
jgi:hypothetical protein